MGRSAAQRYGDTAVIFHWSIALLIVGMLAMGKYMVGLEENDPSRYALTQWHKSIGITILILSVLRLLWRLTHKPPPALSSSPRWQQRSASVAHVLLYLLMLALPITGWIMVSASPLNLPTVLFNVIPWPHLPPFDTLNNRANIAAAFHQFHGIASSVLIVILLAHIGAALKHHVIDKDTTLLRMVPSSARAFKGKSLAVAIALVVLAVALNLYKKADNQVALLAAGNSEVSFLVEVSGEPTPGVFANSTVEALINEANPAQSTLAARVQTASVSSDNYQVAGSLPEPEWFDAGAFPEAFFESSQIATNDDGSLQVTGGLTLKDTTQEVTFPMTLSDEDGHRVARGSFSVDRRDFSIGMESQANDDYVGFAVLIKFRFEVSLPDL